MDLKPHTRNDADGRGSAPAADAALKFEDQGLDEHGPTAHGDPMGTPATDERVLWKGRPDPAVLARTAFHTRSVAIYFALLACLAFAFGSLDKSLVVVGLGALCLVVLYTLAHISARTSLYILTDTRLILRIGMAIETRINVPLKQISAADLKSRGKDFGDIAMELKGERLLGYLLLWPHVRPFNFQRPQPMLRGVKNAEEVAAKFAEARSAFGSIDRSLTQVNEAVGELPQTQPITIKSAQSGGDATGFEGAPA